MCGSNPPSVKYKHNLQERQILVKDVNAIDKWTKGALARRRFTKMVLTKQIAGKCPWV